MDEYQLNLDLPVFVDKFRDSLALEVDGSSRVDVLWQEKCLEHIFVQKTALIHERGWIVVNR